MANPFSYEVQLKAAGGKRKGALLPYLYPYQYGRELHSDEDFYAMINSYRSWIYVASNKNASTVANTPLRLYVAKNNKSQRVKRVQTKAVDIKQERFIRENPFLNNIPAIRKASSFEEVLDHPFLDLKTNVNPFVNSFDLFEMTQLYQELTGNAFWHILEDKFGVPREIWLIPPQNCKIMPDAKKFISGYKYIKSTEEIDLSERSIIHFKMPNPKNQYYGSSPVTSIAEEYGLAKSINEYEAAIFRNGGNNLNGVFETDSELGDHEFERLKIEIKQMLGGASKGGSMPLLDHGLKYKPFTNNSPKDMSYLGGRDRIKEAVLNAFGQALGMYSSEANRNNADAAIATFMQFTIQPRLRRIEEKLNEKMIWRYDEKLFVAYDNCIPSDKLFELNQSVKHIQTSITSVDEERDKLGLPELGGVFKQPFIPVNFTTPSGLLASIAEGTGEGNVVSSPEKMKEILNR